MQGRDEVDLIDYLNVLWKWKWLIVGGTLIAAIVSFVLASRAPLTYEASVTLFLAPSKLPGAFGTPSKPLVSPNTVEDLIREKSLAAEVIQHFGLDQSPHRVTVDSFVSRVLSAKRLGETNVIRLTVNLPDPQLAADAADLLTHKAVELTVRLGQGDTLATRSFFRQQGDQARRALEHARASLIEFRRTANLDSLEIEQKITLEENGRLKILAAEASAEQAGVRTRWEELSEGLKQEEPTLTLSKSIVTDPAVIAAASDYGRTDIKALSALQLKSQEINPTYQDIRKGLINAKASLASLEDERKCVEQKIEENKTKLAEIGKRIASVKPELERLTESNSQAQATYQFWSRKADEAVLLAAAQTPDLRIAQPATVPMTPVSRKVKQKVTFVATAALMICAMLAFFFEYLVKVRQRRRGIR